MDLYESGFDFNRPESLLILTIYAGFWIYSCYSLVVLLIHVRKQNNSVENID